MGELSIGDELELHCIKDFQHPQFRNRKYVKVKCTKNCKFQWLQNNRIYDFKDFNCKDMNMHSTFDKSDNSNCRGNTKIVGFGNENNKYIIPVMEICYEKSEFSIHYVKHKIDKFSCNKIVRDSVLDAIYKKNNKHLYDLQIPNERKWYGIDKQRSTFAIILGQNVYGTYWNGADLSLNKGHLSAQGDYTHLPQVLSTYTFYNIAPQWKNINLNTWGNIIERDVKNLIYGLRNYELYTGTWGTVSLQKKPMYLKLKTDPENTTPNDQIRIPKIYYKVIIDRDTKRGVAIININNPHIITHEDIKDYIICQDKSTLLTRWIDLASTRNKPENGYSYACDVTAFVKIVKDLPNFDVTKGLLI